MARVEVLGEIDERGAVRFEVDRGTTVRGMDGRPFDVIVENFSRTGFLFAAPAELPPGTLISVGLSGAGAREARVVRRDGRRHGCEFLMPLPRREFDHAFRGQEDVVAEIEAELEKRFHAGARKRTPTPSPSLVDRLVAALFGRER